MSRSAAARKPKSKTEKIGATAALSGGGLLATCLLASLIVIIIVALTAEDPLLPQRENSEATAADEQARIGPAPARQLDEFVDLKVRRKDLHRVSPLLTELAEQQGGHRLQLHHATSTKYYALPSDTAQWLTTLDADNGKEAYAALGKTPPASNGQNLTTVAVHIDAPLMQRRLFFDVYRAIGVAAMIGLVTFVIGSGVVIDP